jgi:hypothetical protein
MIVNSASRPTNSAVKSIGSIIAVTGAQCHR